MTDPLPTTVIYGVKVGGTETGSTCTAGAGTGEYTTGSRTVSATIATLAANRNAAIVFQVTVN